MQKPSPEWRDDQMDLHTSRDKTLNKPLRVKRAAGPGDGGD
jgi:hypothetical protein